MENFLVSGFVLNGKYSFLIIFEWCFLYKDQKIKSTSLSRKMQKEKWNQKDENEHQFNVTRTD